MKDLLPKISIIILNWNGKKDTLECLKSVQKIEYKNYEVVVVDNGSSDGSVQAIKSHFKDVKIIENGANLGFAEGNNKGIAYALEQGTDYVFLLNNDTIVESKILNNFLEVTEEYSEVGIFAAKIYYYDEPNKIWYAGAAWLPQKARFTQLGFNQIDDGFSWNEIKETAYACGCALLIKANVIKKIGMLEPKYFLTWEETDWCYKAYRAGYKCLFVPKAIVWHKVSASFSGGNQGLLVRYFMERNRLLWIERNLTFKEKKLIYHHIIFKEIYQSFREYFNSETTQQKRLICKVKLAALRDYIFRRFGDCPSSIRSVAKL
ncbi:MAG: glycosyltransferase family 2 protein [Hydrococcus sp. Prado102]|jgi:hypothetical protein|nr:glycosyltransferase family 2 protein [Hydrococcus sp. Prado102]